ncbi:MAG: TnpV protein [Desulfobacteraceae bacterium]|nr:TnpV protein [Desulfobacteraceae bacterium]
MSKITFHQADLIPTGIYARMAHQYLEENFPQELSKMMSNKTITKYLKNIQNETTKKIQDRIQELQIQFRKKNPNPGYLEKTSNYEHHRRTAEEEILPTMIATVIPNL